MRRSSWTGTHPGRGIAEEPRGLRDHLSVGHVAAHGEDHAPRPVVALVVGAERGPVEPLESRRAPERGRAVRVAPVQARQHGIEGDRVRLVLTVADRPQELAALAVQLVRGQRRVQSDVGDQLEQSPPVAPQCGPPDLGEVGVARRADAPADPLRRQGDLQRRAARRALRQDLLEERGDPGIVRRFPASPDPDEQRHGDEGRRGVLVDEDRETVGQLGLAALRGDRARACAQEQGERGDGHGAQPGAPHESFLFGVSASFAYDAPR